MARRVRCVYCKEYGIDDNFHKVPKKGYSNRFSYYCSKEEYELDQLKQYKENVEKDKYKELIDFVMRDIYNYEKGMMFPSTLAKRIQKLRSFYEYEIIRVAFEHSREVIDWAINNKRFENEYNKTSYIMAIVESKINDVYLEVKRKESQHEQILQQEKSVDVEMFNETMDENTVKKKVTKDISSFLD